MTEIEKAFLTILRDALHPRDEISDLKIDWASVFETAKKQNLFPFVYDAATVYPSFGPFEESHPEYFPAATASMTAQMRKTDAFLSLYRSFLASGLSPITMKGIICRTLYGDKGDLRPSGDEDILIEKKDFEKASEVMKRCGYKAKNVPDSGLRRIQEVEFNNTECGLTVELHLNLFGTNSATRDKMNNWFDNVFQSDETMVIDAVPVRTMTPTDHFLFLVLHAFKHFTLGGFGVRLMLDILLFAEKYDSRIDWEYITTALEDVSVCGFLADLVEIGNAHLGFGLTQHYQAVCPDELLDDMLRMGTFGNTTNADRTVGRIVSDTLQEKGKGGKTHKNKAALYFRLLFPSWRTWTSWRPYLNDKPWMIIPEWFWRFGRYMRGETATSDLRVLDKSSQIADARIELLEKYGVL